ncbi:sorting nexin-14-like [Paramacrobiotus metropolitanus]|uniref:sorting nexin-14-like n=1 Tax=Paramacrobiotus metropolitanus TaxID=2943436 RepID=UPI002445A7E6|nr:sorting nexin-14-like [Paramacrobiotus metropolitanus]XP_055328691.1 sorting nexin-14-like [Paramacrobiotus metropolitanus]
MENMWEYLESALVYSKGKPFSSLQQIFFCAVVVTTCINIFHCGFFWTVIFVLVSAFLGGATFLLIVDESNGGIVAEIRKLVKLLRLYPSFAWLQRFFPEVEAPKPAYSGASRASTTIERTGLSSVSLERIYPWMNLHAPKVLDDALTRFFEIIINQYVIKDWYHLVQVRKNFVTEIRWGLRFSASRLARKLSSADFTRLIHEKTTRAVVSHISVYLQLRHLAKTSHETNLEALLKKHEELSHPALKSEGDEDFFYYNISRKLLLSLLPREYRRFPASVAVLREVLIEMVLKVAVESFSEPSRINYLVAVGLSSLGQQAEAATVETEDVDLSPVPFLKNLVNDDKQPSTIQKVPFRQILKETSLKNIFEQHLKALGLEDFYRIHESMEWINKFLDSAVLGEAAMKSTYASVAKLKKEIEAARVKGYAFPAGFVEDVEDVVKTGISGVPKLRGSSAWKETCKLLISLIENILVPGFQETRLYHHLLIPPTEEISKRRRRALQQRSRQDNPASFQQLSETVRGAFKDVPPVVERQDLYDEFDGQSQFPEDDFVDDLDSENQFNEDALGSTLRDLLYYDLTVNRAERRRDDRGNVFMVLNIMILDRGPLSPDQGKVWSVQRKYSEFYILDAKIREFHGTLDASSYLPPKRAWFAPTLEYLQMHVGNFERFLKSLIKEPKLRYSQMLYTFLATTVEFDASSGFPDLGLSRVMRSVPQILQSERGQNVDTFIRSLLNSALPQTGKNFKSASEVSPSPSDFVEIVDSQQSYQRLHDIPFDLPDAMLQSKGTENAHDLEDIFDQLMYLLSTVAQIDPELLGLFVCCKSFAKPVVGDGSYSLVEKFVNFFKQPKQLTFLVDLLSDALTGAYPPVDSAEKERRASAALDLLNMVMDNPMVEVMCGKNAENVTKLLFDMVQYRLLNKRLALVLLDLIIEEVFPEVDSMTACYVDEP